MKVGVLALQGAFFEHVRMVEKCGHEGILIKTISDFKKINRLIIPGGESTTIGKLLAKYHLDEKIINLYRQTNIPIFGTCAGMIVLAKEIEGNDQHILGLMNIKVKRNAYGRQVDSFEEKLEIQGITPPSFQGIFIRAPYINKIGDNIKPLCIFQQRVVMAREGNILVSSFHPELGEDLRVHQYFLNIK